MVEREEIMIVRKIYVANSLPNIGAMFPQSEGDEKVSNIILKSIFSKYVFTKIKK